MAETFNKKERNKKKLQKRKEKELRRDEKRHEGPSSQSLDDMLAYVDENGNLSSTPPDLNKKQVFELEEIMISTPKAVAEDPDALPTGKISYFDSSKGYGFINSSNNLDRIFVHVSQLADPSITLNVGDKVVYKAIKGPRGLQAEMIQK